MLGLRKLWLQVQMSVLTVKTVCMQFHKHLNVPVVKLFLAAVCVVGECVKNVCQGFSGAFEFQGRDRG